MSKEDGKQPQSRIVKFIEESPILLKHQKEQLLRNLSVIAEEEQATASQILGNIEKVLGINDEDLPLEERGYRIVETLKTVKENIDEGLNVLPEKITEEDKKERENFDLEKLSGLLTKTLNDTLNNLILKKLEDDKIRTSNDKTRTSIVIAAVLEGLLETTWHRLTVSEQRRITDRLQFQYKISFDPDPDKV